MVAPIVYLSTDASAPVLTGQAGSMIALLDACLVNGYGAKAAAGWTKPFTGTNLAAYRMGTGGTARRMYLRVDDTATQSARVRGFDEMTDINTGTEPFPTVAQFADPGLWLHKSDTVSAAAREWLVMATPHTALVLVRAASGAMSSPSPGTTSFGALLFGQYSSYVASFAHNVILIGGVDVQISQGCSFGMVKHEGGTLAALQGHFVPRSHIDVAGAVNVTKEYSHAPRRASLPAAAGVLGGLQTPSPVDGKLAMSRMQVWAPASPWAVIGHLDGVWVPHAQGYVGNPLDTIAGSGSQTGRTLLAIDAPGADNGRANQVGRLLIDTTDWD